MEKDKKILNQIKKIAKNAQEIYLSKQEDKLILNTNTSDECWGYALKVIPK